MKRPRPEKSSRWPMKPRVKCGLLDIIERLSFDFTKTVPQASAQMDREPDFRGSVDVSRGLLDAPQNAATSRPAAEAAARGARSSRPARIPPPRTFTPTPIQQPHANDPDPSPRWRPVLVIDDLRPAVRGHGALRFRGGDPGASFGSRSRPDLVVRGRAVSHRPRGLGSAIRRRPRPQRRRHGPGNPGRDPGQ